MYEENKTTASARAAHGGMQPGWDRRGDKQRQGLDRAAAGGSGDTGEIISDFEATAPNDATRSFSDLKV